MLVLKFGGTSVANAENIKKVVNIVSGKKEDKKLFVVSALSGVTDKLIEIGTLAANKDASYEEKIHLLSEQHLTAVKALLPVTNQSAALSMVMQAMNELEDIAEGVYRLQELSLASKDKIVGFGELLSSKIISAYMQSLHIDHQWVDSRELIVTDNNHSNANVLHTETSDNIRLFIDNSSKDIFIAPGFIARSADGVATTLGRGGSDYTAALFAAATGAKDLEIWTDVSGMMTADPRIVKNVRIIPAISYKEAMELSHFGAKVIYPPTIQPAMAKEIPIWIKNTFSPEDKGTVIQNLSPKDGEVVTGISSISQVSLISLEGSGMVGIPGFSKVLFEALASAKINVILITQSSSEHSICVAVNGVDGAKAAQVVNKAFAYEIETKRLEPVKEESGLSIIALVGDKMKSHPGISGKMFAALGRNGINIRAIAQGSSEKNISAVISSADVKKAVNTLHERFFEKASKQINVYIVGTGNVGGKLIEQIKEQKEFLLQNLNLNLRVVGISNSKKAALATDEQEELSLDNWLENLENGNDITLDTLTEKIILKNLRNSVVIDVTANKDVARTYDKFLAKSISVVACNKIACSSEYAYYQKLKQLSNDYNVSFLFETNVGAGLPVIGTLNDLMRSGDEITKIQAVLSGTLNFVFNNYNGTESFAAVVRRAQDEGYTEPDPRQDLGGTDVMRKIMILARESGYPLEMEDINNNGFLPASCFNGSVEDFYAELEKHEEHFKKLYADAQANNCKLKYVAAFEEGKASVGLQQIPSDSDFYHLYGKDNIVLYYTKRYVEQPLVVKGAGAGGDVTASGVFADIIKTVS